MDMTSPQNYAEQALLQTHFDLIPFNVYVVDMQNHDVVFINRMLRETLGAFNPTDPCYKMLYQQDEPCIFCNISKLLAEGKPHHEPLIFDNYNEVDERWYQVHDKAIAWPDGRTVKYTISVDISELKMTQNRLAEAHAELALKNKELGHQNDLLSENIRLREDVENITRHDLKNPLGAIIGIPDMVQDDYPELPEDIHKCMKLVGNAGRQMLSMINNSLDMYKMEKGAYEVMPDTVDLAAVIRRVVSDLTGEAETRDVAVSFTLDGHPVASGQRVEIESEELLCYSLVSNLLKNAVEAAPTGTAVDIDMARDKDVIVSIANKGEVPQNIRSRFFDKYATMGKHGGTGLGTYSAMLIARTLGGDIELDTKTQGYTRVDFRLPYRQSSI